MLTAAKRVGSFRYLESATKSVACRSSRNVSSIAREIITGNSSSLIGDWNNGEEGKASTVSLSTMQLMHHHLVGLHKDHVQPSHDLFSSLINASGEIKDKWTESDHLLVSACKYAVEERDYMKAAVCLESITSKNMPDPAILRLTQEFYTLAGRPDLLLRSVIRYPSSFHCSDDFRPSVFGMLGAGYAELGHFQEADEIARKSRAISTEVDVNLIATIIDGHNLSGKSSEVKTVMDEELVKYQNLGGLSLLQCGQATSKFIRGNVNFVYNELVSIFDVDFNNNTATHHDDFVYNAPVLLKSSFLLLQVLMNLTVKHNMELDRLALLMHRQLLMHDRDHRTYTFIHCMLLATQYVALETMNHSRLILNKPVLEQTKSQSLWANVFGSAKPKRKVVSSATPDSNALPFVREEELARSLEKIDFLIAQLEKQVNFDQIIRPLIPDINQEEHLSFLYPSNANTMSLSLADNAGMDLLSIAVLNFAKKNFEMSSKIMAVLYQRNYRDLGLRMALRDVAHQLFIESLLRNNQFHSAKILLIERTIMAPNDGQTWRRLGIIHELSGQKKEAEEANYTAWQLGIGQGGFGGAE